MEQSLLLYSYNIPPELRDHCGQRDRFLRAKVIVKLFLLHISNVVSIESHKHECLNMNITSIQSQKHNCLNMR